MSVNDPNVLDRLQRARQKKEKPASKPLGRGTKAEPEKPEPGKKAEKKSYPKRIGRSEKMRGIMQATKPLYEVYLEQRPDCEIKSPVCTGQALYVHHTEGRGVSKIMDQRSWMACCSACNDWVENNDGQAQAMGAKKSRHTKHS